MEASGRTVWVGLCALIVALGAYPLRSAEAGDAVVAQLRDSLPLELPVPGSERSSVKLSVVSSEVVSVPVLRGKSLTRRVVDVPVYQLSDSGAVFGVATKTSGGYYGTLVDLSAKKHFLYQLSPVTGEKFGDHLITRVAEDEVLARTRSHEAERVLDTPALAAKMTLTTPVSDPPAKLWRALQAVIVSPSEFTGERVDEDIVAHVTQIVKRANLYSAALRLQVQIAAVQIFRRDEGDPYSDAAARKDAHAMLQIVRKEWSNVSVPEHDVVVVLGRGDFKGLWGLAYKGVVCTQPDYSFVFASQGGMGPLFEVGLADTFSHELGHVVGMSHDTQVYPQGPSLMWPGYVLTPFGYSAKSLTEFEIYAGPQFPGGACLGGIDIQGEGGSSSAPLKFRGGSKQRFVLREEEPFRHVFEVQGGVSVPVFDTLNLPLGASLGTLTGIFEFTPPDEKSKKSERKVRFTVLASDIASEVSKEIELVIRRVNHPPRISFSPRVVSATVGRRVELRAVAQDRDSGDSAKLRFLSSRVLVGKKSIRAERSSVRIRWTPSAPGNYELRFEAADREGAKTLGSVAVRVSP